nr:MAG TPA: hypothetical protein [Caudoviricetes sp.]
MVLHLPGRDVHRARRVGAPARRRGRELAPMDQER